MTLRTLLVKLGFKGDIKGITDFDNKITGLKSNILGLGAIFASITASLGYFLNEAAKLEQTKIAFEVMTNSVQFGRKLIKDLFTFARTTPFRIPGVLQASKILLAMGITAEEQIDVLTQIGHVAAGIGKPLDQLASIFGRVRAAGYLTGYEMERLRRAGVPLGAYLSELLKKPEKDILRMIRRKEISFAMFQEGWELMVEKRFPRLMDKLLLTFKGIVSNIKDYIYEIVAFSGEELLPIAKLMANQLMYLLDSSRELIALKFKQFFGGVSNALVLLNKGFIKLYFRIIETSKQFGGINRLFKIFISLFGVFVGMKSLALLGRIGKIMFSLLSIASLKLALIGVAMIGIFAVTEDLLGYLIGKKSVIEDILNLIENKAPRAYNHLIKWLRILKKEIEGLSLLSIGLFEGLTTGDWSMARAGMEQVSEAWKMMFKKAGKEQFGPIQMPSAKTPTLPMYKTAKEFAEYAPTYKRTIGEKIVKGDIAKGIIEFMQNLGRGYGLPIGPRAWGEKIFSGAMKDVRRDFAKEISTFKYIQDRKSALRETVPEEILRKGKLMREGLEKLHLITMPVSINFEKLPGNVDDDRIIREVKATLNDVVTKKLDDTLRAGMSSVEPDYE